MLPGSRGRGIGRPREPMMNMKNLSSLLPVILATWEAEIRRIVVHG
jgi:hypothetical protein